MGAMSGYEAMSTAAGVTRLQQATDKPVPNREEDLLSGVWDSAAEDLLRLILAMGIDRGRAEDALHDVYLTARQKAPAGLGGVELRRWLFRVTTNRCNLEHRRRARWRGAFRGLVRRWRQSRGEAQPADAAARSEERELVAQALDRMKPLHRSVLVLRYFQGLDSKEIGRILDMPDSTVRSHLRVARKILADELTRAGYRDE